MTQHDDEVDRVLDRLVTRSQDRDKVDLEKISRLVVRLDERAIAQDRRIGELERDLDNNYVPLQRYTTVERLMFGLVILFLGSVMVAIVQLVVNHDATL